jgi:formylglycine-generating enzyme required for sulfatase activity
MKKTACVCAVLLGFVTLAALPQPAARATADTTPPTGSIVIDANRSATNSRNVTLSLAWADTGGSGVARMRFSNDGSTWSAYESLRATKSYSLPSGTDSHRTVRVQFIDVANNRSATYSDYIRLDRALPTGGILINAGASTTLTRSVALKLNWADAGAGVTRMRFSDNGSTWTGWLYPKTSRTHTLPAGLGNHTVRVQYLDGAGNYSTVYSDYIKLVEPSPGAVETVMLPGDVPLVMKWMPSGSFMMGRYPGEVYGGTSQDPQHSVTLGGYWMAKYELTKRQWAAVMGTMPWSGQSNVLADLDSPAVYVSWDDAQAFLTAVNGYTGKTFRLPSEAQWEYACRAGTQTRFYWGDDPNYTAVGDYAWYDGNAYYLAGQQYAHLAGQKLPNAWGLYDMAGNVNERCEDDWHADYTGAPAGGQAWVDSPRGSYRVLRGCSWSSGAQYSRSAFRDYYFPTSDHASSVYGFRLARTP